MCDVFKISHFHFEDLIKCETRSSFLSIFGQITDRWGIASIAFKEWYFYLFIYCVLPSHSSHNIMHCLHCRNVLHLSSTHFFKNHMLLSSLCVNTVICLFVFSEKKASIWDFEIVYIVVAADFVFLYIVLHILCIRDYLVRSISQSAFMNSLIFVSIFRVMIVWQNATETDRIILLPENRGTMVKATSERESCQGTAMRVLTWMVWLHATGHHLIKLNRMAEDMTWTEIITTSSSPKDLWKMEVRIFLSLIKIILYW